MPNLPAQKATEVLTNILTSSAIYYRTDWQKHHSMGSINLSSKKKQNLMPSVNLSSNS